MWGERPATSCRKTSSAGARKRPALAAADVSGPLREERAMLFAGAMGPTISGSFSDRTSRKCRAVFSLLSVVAITFLIFVGVAATARVILGK